MVIVRRDSVANKFLLKLCSLFDNFIFVDVVVKIVLLHFWCWKILEDEKYDLVRKGMSFLRNDAKRR